VATPILNPSEPNHHDPEFQLFGNVAKGFNSRDPECLMSGAAGTGKTLANLLRVYWICRTYPGARVLIVRKTRESLTESVLVTWERDILGPTHPIITKNPTLRRVRQSYRFPNGSTVVLGGMDKPDKVLSSEWDLIYIPEAIELNVTDWETLSGRLRSGVVPYQQMIADTNPTTPANWLYKRCMAGICRKIETTHRDNPRYFNRAANEWTEEGKQYLARLERMTGARRVRFLEGRWEAAEGVVYDGFIAKVAPEGHLMPEGWRPPADWPRFWGIDWGYTAPLSMGFWAVDGDGRAYLYRERYTTHLRVETLAKWVAEEVSAGRERMPVAAVCDHDPECHATFLAHGPPGVNLEMADKSDRDGGIQAMQGRFDDAGDGRPRIFFCQDSRDHPADPYLIADGKPTSGLEELVGYCWKKDSDKDEPMDKDDHFCDQGRYALRRIDQWFASRGDMYGGSRQTSPLAGLRPGTFRDMRVR